MGRTDGQTDGQTDGVTALLDLLSPLATQVKIKKKITDVFYMYISNKEINIFNKHHTDSTITTLTYQYSNFLVSEIMLLHVFEYVSYHLKSNKMC